MQEELNTRLLQKISYLEKGAVLGMIVCSCFFLAAILYFVKANVYVILISGLKKKVAHVRNKIKRKRVRRIGGKGKNEITNKAYFKLIVLAFVGVGSIYTYRTYYVEAAVITQLAIDEDTEVMDNTAGDIGEKSPKLYLESKGWIGGTGEFAQYLFSKDNRTFTIGVEENTFHSDLEKESFLFQVSEKESGIDQEGFNKIRQYEQGEFERKDSDNPIYQKTLSFETEKNRQKVYSLYLEYINRWGMPLIGDKGAVENYGNILLGTFKSKKLVIDKKCPEIAGLKLEKADKKKEGIRFAKKSVSETYNTDEIYNTDKKCNTDITYNIDEECYYNTSVKGMIDIREKYLDLDSIHIQAMPLDDRAREVVKENEAESNDGMLDILAWTHTKKGNLHQISFDFAVEGKWKFILDCADLAGNRESVEISLKKIDDRNVLKKEWSYERAESENTVQVQWDNIKKTENSDGIYYLQIKGQDKAGNKIKDDFKVVFRVNQRGADFILSHALKKKINKYYLKEAPKIKLREQCVKQTKSRAVILKDNEERKVIGESSITSSVIADKKSERYGWYEKYYNFAKKDFEREGDYRVTFQADTKEKELRFVVDKTPPVVHIGNLDKQIYEEKEHEFTIRVMDNYAFKELELYMETDRNILGQKGTKKIIIKPKDLDENYMVRKTLTADKRYQTVRYIARDKAGNVIDSNDNGDTKVCLVTDSKTVKEYQEHKKEYMLIGIISTLGIFIVISGSGLFIFTRRKRNLK